VAAISLVEIGVLNALIMPALPSRTASLIGLTSSPKLGRALA
jgi:hypothetical protein